MVGGYDHEFGRGFHGVGTSVSQKRGSGTLICNYKTGLTSQPGKFQRGCK